ncbi:hypothetical protein K7X08_007003 [Anisodus acutangulus]|uniref:Uncharacterized protein n=1 Tax=Anisodus acutangulus TaxID=402998 RepID=A0A9Q1LBT7_9SOLA|nr:hypothetical protein K7X08_007003 [Anisodus acutangulus]
MVTPYSGIPHTLAPLKLGSWLPTGVSLPENVEPMPEVGIEEGDGLNAVRKLMFSGPHVSTPIDGNAQVKPPTAADLVRGNRQLKNG